jgi:acyl dehydratase
MSMSTEQNYFSDLEVGHVFGPVEHVTTPVQLFRYSAITWNPHRIHFDKEYAAAEGYPDVLVHSHLHGAFVTELCADIAGAHGKVTMVDVSVRRFAVPGDVLACTAVVTALEPHDERFGLLHLDVEETRVKDRAVCAPASATILLPLSAASAGVAA